MLVKHKLIVPHVGQLTGADGNAAALEGLAVQLQRSSSIPVRLRAEQSFTL